MCFTTIPCSGKFILFGVLTTCFRIYMAMSLKGFRALFAFAYFTHIDSHAGIMGRVQASVICQR